MTPGHELATFTRRQEGSLTLLSLLLFVVMFLIGGLAVDMLIFENNRTRLQGVSDRASLAAANLDQSLPAEDVVASYFEKEGLSGYLQAVEVTESGGARTVGIVASQPMKTMFMRMVGTTDLTAPASATATEAVGNVEISLVLDNSGSMGTIDGRDGKSRLVKLKEAVGTFLDVMYPDGTNPEFTVSIVPYATQVNAGPLLTGQMNVTAEHAYSDCIEFEDEDFATLGLDTGKLYNRSAHFSMFETDSHPDQFKCRPNATQHISILQSDPQAVRDRVDALTAEGQTSLELGAKWGAALLDPSTNGIVRALVAGGQTDILPDNADRPVAYNDRRTVKVLILMTDGINTYHYNMKPAWKSGVSDLYRGRATLEELLSGAIPGLTPSRSLSSLRSRGVDTAAVRTVYSRVLTESGNYDRDGTSAERYWIPRLVVSGTEVWAEQWVGAPLSGAEAPGTEDPSGRMKWVELWNEMPPRYYADAFLYAPYNDSSAENNFMNNLYTTVQPDSKDARLDTLCTTARARGLTVYTVGLNVTSHSRGVLRDCASNENFFLDATSDNLEAAFRDIAESILALKLRLIQ